MIPWWVALLIAFGTLRAGYLLGALMRAAKDAELRTRIQRLRAAIEKHMGPRYLGNGMSAACCDPELSAVLAETQDDE